MKAVLCPVCNGCGEYNYNKCHGCSGKGWVEVEEDKNDWYFPPCYPYYPPYRYPDWWWWEYPTTPYCGTISIGNTSDSQTLSS